MPKLIRDTGPSLRGALLANGSAGIAWVDDPEIGSGILTGSCGRVIFVEMEQTDLSSLQLPF